MLCLGKSVPLTHSNKRWTGLSQRINASHGKGGTKEVGEVTTITGGHINFHDLELFFVSF